MKPRSYKSPRRTSAAVATRRAILEAALALFQSEGYVRTPMSEIARKADVSVNTIYASVGNKPQLLIALTQDASTDDGIEETLTSVETEASATDVVGLIARGTREVFEQNDWVLGVLYDNAAGDAQIAAVTAAADKQYRERIQQAAERLDALRSLQPNVDAGRAGEILWFYFGYRPWRDLRELGWSWDQAQEWLTDQATRAVLPIDGQRG